MPRLRTFIATVTPLVLGGCSTLPQPDDWPVEDTTFSIIAKARCEMKFALVDQLIEILKSSNAPVNQRLRSGQVIVDDDIVDNLGEQLQQLRDSPSADTRKRLRDEIRDLTFSDVGTVAEKKLQRFDRAGIGYTFKISSQEVNDNTLDFGFVIPFSGDTLQVGVTGGAKFDRKDERTITLQDSFYLLQNLDCDKLLASAGAQRPAGERFVYPMTGQIGIESVVQSFLETASEADPKIDPGGCTPESSEDPAGNCDMQLTDFTDKITFQTTLEGSITPTLTFSNPAQRRGLQLEKGTITAKPQRVDTHELTIVMKAGEPESDDGTPLPVKKADQISTVKTADGATFTVLFNTPKKKAKAATEVVIVTGAPPRQEKFVLHMGGDTPAVDAASIRAAPAKRILRRPNRAVTRAIDQRLKQLESLDILGREVRD